MNLCLTPRAVRAATPEPPHETPFQRPDAGSIKASLTLDVGRILGAVFLLVALTMSVLGQNSVTLAWDRDVGTNIAGYKLYYGVACRTYTNTINVGNQTNATVSNLAAGTVYYFAVTAYDTSGVESDYSNEAGCTNPAVPAPTIALSSPANSANFTAPATIACAASVTANGHTITQVQFYNGTTLIGTVAAAPYTYSWNNVNTGSYSLSARAVYDSGSVVSSAAANITVAAPPLAGLTFAADSGAFTAPFVDNNGLLSQSVLTSVTNGGQAVYTFSITNAGNYLVSAMVIAPDTGADSFYVNIDSQPTDPLMIWDIPVCTSLTNSTVSWRGSTGTGDPATSQFIPKVFSLSAGTHQLIIVGREANTTLGTISIVATNASLPTIAITAPVNGATYSAPATITCAASVAANGHTITQVQFYNGTTLLGTVAAAPYIYSWNNVAAGSCSLSARAIYDSGSTVTCAPVTVSVASTALPSIALTAPANGATYTAPASITCAASVTANGHTITQVQFYNGTTLLGTVASAPYTYSWNNVNAGGYSLSAKAVYDSGSTIQSASATITVTSLLPPWQTMDIGSLGLAGTASTSNGLFTVAGAGQISGTADSFRFLYQPMSGDGSIQTCISSAQNTGSAGDIGLMIRESLTSGSKYAFMGLQPNYNFRWQRRSSTAGSTASTTSGSGTPPSTWVRLVRSSGVFYGYKSLDGTNWTQVTRRSINMATNIYVGIAVASGVSNVLNTSTFTNVTVVP
jgi:hypothetical protein